VISYHLLLTYVLAAQLHLQLNANHAVHHGISWLNAISAALQNSVALTTILQRETSWAA